MKMRGAVGALLAALCLLGAACSRQEDPLLVPAPPVPTAAAVPNVSPAPGREDLLRQAAQAALDACVTEDMSELEKLTALHDWLCLRCEYAPTPAGESAYGAVAEGLAVCRGYAAGYAYLARAAGLDGTDTYSQEADHAWILATLDGTRYFSDATWDDGKGPCLGLIRHSYFLFDEASAAETGHVGWDSGEAVSGGPLEQVPWASAVTRVIFRGDACWYIDGDFALCRCDRESWETERLFSLEDRWSAEDETPYTGLIWLEGRLWFNTPREIRSVLPDGTDMRTELAPDTGERQIYGLGVQDGRLCYSLSDAPDAVLFDVVQTDVDASAAWGRGPGM